MELESAVISERELQSDVGVNEVGKGMRGRDSYTETLV